MALARPVTLEHGALRIESKQSLFHAPQLGGKCKVDAQGRFTRPAFLTYNSDSFHICL